jgi:tetraacyldisaccharide 4'-kinase
MSFSDHHIYTIDDLNEVKKKLGELQADKKMMITTEKDAVRLLKFNDALIEMPLYVLPVQHSFLAGGTQFDDIVTNFIETFSRDKIYE